MSQARSKIRLQVQTLKLFPQTREQFRALKVSETEIMTIASKLHQ